MPTPDIDINYAGQLAKCHVCGNSATLFENVAPYAASGGSMRPVCCEHSMYQSAERLAAKERADLKAALLAAAEEGERHKEAVDALVKRNIKLREWVTDLQSGMYVNCVYCGHRYGPGETTPVSMADALKAHIEQCPEHPMSKLKSRLALAEAVVKTQAADAGLWFRAEAVTEDILQRALRRLHEAVEGKSAAECAVDALTPATET